MLEDIMRNPIKVSKQINRTFETGYVVTGWYAHVQNHADADQNHTDERCTVPDSTLFGTRGSSQYRLNIVQTHLPAAGGYYVTLAADHRNECAMSTAMPVRPSVTRNLSLTASRRFSECNERREERIRGAVWKSDGDLV
jgi:hypothetical protein